MGRLTIHPPLPLKNIHTQPTPKQPKVKAKTHRAPRGVVAQDQRPVPRALGQPLQLLQRVHRLLLVLFGFGFRCSARGGQSVGGVVGPGFVCGVW